MKELALQARAKINWTLNVCGTDQRGYHLLDMLMQSVSLADTVVLQSAEHISLTVSDPRLPTDETNLAWRAAATFFTETRIPGGCKIYLEKRIPFGAGMGGGSADAAAVLVGLNRLFEANLWEKQLADMALTLGADVPFLLSGGLSRATGIGEKLEHLSAPSYWLLVAAPQEEPALTKTVYHSYDALGSCERPQNDRFLKALQQGDLSGMRSFGGNALFEAACQSVPAIAELKSWLSEAGAGFCSMTGSGSAVFGVFQSKETAMEAQQHLPPGLWNAVMKTEDTGIVLNDKEIEVCVI